MVLYLPPWSSSGYPFPDITNIIIIILNNFIHLQFRWYSPSWLPLQNPSIPFFASLRVLLHLLPHSHLIALASFYAGTSNLHRRRAFPFIDNRQSNPLLYMYLEPWIPPYVSLVGGLVSGRELWVVQLVDIVLPMGLQTPSAPSVLPLTPPLGSLCSVWWLATSIYICIGQALAEPLRRQLCQEVKCVSFGSI